MQPQPIAERMHPYVWPGAPPAHNWSLCKLKTSANASFLSLKL
jgi:hypothetical protein